MQRAHVHSAAAAAAAAAAAVVNSECQDLISGRIGKLVVYGEAPHATVIRRLETFRVCGRAGARLESCWDPEGGMGRQSLTDEIDDVVWLRVVLLYRRHRHAVECAHMIPVPRIHSVRVERSALVATLPIEYGAILRNDLTRP